MLVNFDGSRKNLDIVKKSRSISKINISQQEQKEWLPGVF